MSKQLYNVTIELVCMVYAESPEDAKEIARGKRAFEDDLACNGTADAEVRIADYMPGMYAKDELVYSSEDRDITVKEAAIESGNEFLFTESGPA